MRSSEDGHQTQQERLSLFSLNNLESDREDPGPLLSLLTCDDSR